jgi:hypothetical protein
MYVCRDINRQRMGSARQHGHHGSCSSRQGAKYRRGSSGIGKLDSLIPPRLFSGNNCRQLIGRRAARPLHNRGICATASSTRSHIQESLERRGLETKIDPRLGLVARTTENLNVLVNILATKGQRSDVVDISGRGKDATRAIRALDHPGLADAPAKPCGGVISALNGLTALPMLADAREGHESRVVSLTAPAMGRHGRTVEAGSTHC